MKRLPAALAVAVVARMAFHAVFLPAFEGPDEPQHLARVRDFALRTLPEAIRRTRGGRRNPFRPRGLSVPRRTFTRRSAAPRMGSRPAPSTSSVRRRSSCLRPAPALFRTWSRTSPRSSTFWPACCCGPFDLAPAPALLACRLLSVALVAIALFWPLRILAKRSAARARCGGPARPAPAGRVGRPRPLLERRRRLPLGRSGPAGPRAADPRGPPRGADRGGTAPEADGDPRRRVRRVRLRSASEAGHSPRPARRPRSSFCRCRRCEAGCGAARSS